MWFTFKGSIWEPTEKQWWVTGFNLSYFGNVDASKQVMICSVDFSQDTDKFESLTNQMKGKLGHYLIFDEQSYTVWIIWYESENI